MPLYFPTSDVRTQLSGDLDAELEEDLAALLPEGLAKSTG
jgi:hypothetical protein